jgi:hypothetical protein
MRQDILLDVTGDLAIANGDFLVGESDAQHVELVLSTNPNDWKANPTTGAALVKTIGGNITGFAKRNIQLQLEADGYALDKLNINETGIDVLARAL